MDKNLPEDVDLINFRAEAEQVLGIKRPTTPKDAGAVKDKK